MAGAHRVGGGVTLPRRHLLTMSPPPPPPVVASPLPPPHSPPPSPPPSAVAAYLPYRNGSVNLGYLKAIKWSSNLYGRSFSNSSFWATSLGTSGVADSSRLVPTPPNYSPSSSACPPGHSGSGQFASNNSAVTTTTQGVTTTAWADRTPWFEVDLGASASIGVVEVWFGANLGNLSAIGCGVNVYVSSTSQLVGGYGTPQGLDIYSQARGYRNCTAEASPHALSYATLASCGFAGRFVTVQLAHLPGQLLNPGTTCGQLQLCSLQVYGSFLPPAPADNSLSPALIKSFSIPVGVFLLLLVPFCMWLAFRRSAAKKQQLLEHWPIITPKRLVTEEAPPATPPTRGKALMAESRRGEEQRFSPTPSKAMSSLDGMGGGGLGEGYGGGTLAKAPGSPGAEFTRNPLHAGGEDGGATPSAPPARQEAWY